ncbi:MAG TPA: polysaccharide biosynthesis C-terminal domain-containing protein [Flavobacteriales bacterium]
MSALRKLAGQTAIYGLSSIVARFLNFLLVPLYTSQYVFEPAEYGVVTALYSWTALLNVVLTFGLETTFFRFASRSPSPSEKGQGDDGRSTPLPGRGAGGELQAPLSPGEGQGVRLYSTATWGLFFPALAFMLFGGVFSNNIAEGLDFGAYTSSVLMLVLIIGIDAITTIPMARLRQQGRPWKYAFINLLSVLVNIALSVFFLLYCMKRYNMGQSNALIDAVYDPALGVAYVFAINLVSTAVKLLVLLPSWPSFKPMDKDLLRAMFAFGAPLMVAGLAGMVNETADRVILKYLLPDDPGSEAGADAQIGIYGACYKLAVLITLFIQAFRMGAEPFFFSHAKEKNSAATFARIMNIFVAVCMAAFLVVMLFLDLFKWFIPNPAYHVGLRVVPILMLANVFLGIYYNQSVWYKLTDRPRVGSTISLIGAILTIVLLFALIPALGYMGAAWTTLICYFSMAAISYLWGQRSYPIPYDVSRVLLYIASAVVLWWGCEQLPLEGVFKYMLRSFVLLGFVAVAWRMERGALKA